MKKIKRVIPLTKNAMLLKLKRFTSKRLIIFLLIELVIFTIIINLIIPPRIINAQKREFDIYDSPYINKISPGTQKGLYLTGYSMGNPAKREEIYKIIQECGLNCIVFNAKDDEGFVDYDTKVKFAEEIGSNKNFYNLDSVLAEMDSRNIYTIARVVVFKDSILPKSRPDLAIKDKRNGKPFRSEGAYWPDIYSEEVWDYNIQIVKELAERGVDEVQFDYIRAPAKGNIVFADYTFNTGNNTKSWAITNFLKKVREQTQAYNIKISADVFGFTFIEENDQGIGQLMEAMVPYLDYIYPMSYPSHYPPNFLGYVIPDEHPYEVVKYTLEKGINRIGNSSCMIIPWIQAFSLKVKYTKDDILAQIRAADELGIKGFLCWNAANYYKTVDSALKEK